MPTDHLNPIHKLLEDARKRLVETGTRNRLVHVNRKKKRANVINIVNERSDDIFNILWTNKKAMSFLPLLRVADDDGEDDGDASRLELIDTNEEFDEARYQDDHLETRMTPDALQKRLLRLYRDARTAESEQGVNILYLALGFLTWFEDEASSIPREAPLILLPVELKRNTRTATYDVHCRDDDLSENMSLRERLQGDFGISLPPISDNPQFYPSGYFAKMAEALSAHPRWSIDPDGMQLGFFSFSKLLMLRDLDPKNWGGSRLDDNALVRALLHEGFESEPPVFAPEDKLDRKLEPADIIQVVDADASQTKVIEEVRAGRNLVVQGPPGTGKSQTITNIIAAAAYDGKRVLFVAEKMPALTVVHDRLVKAGLQDLCLELHSYRANKKAIVSELGRTLKSGQSIPDLPPDPQKLKKARDTLNKISGLLHRPVGDTQETPFAIIGALVKYHGAGEPPPSIKIEGVEYMRRADADGLAEKIQQFAKACAKVGPQNLHPFRGVQELSLQPTDLDRLPGQTAPRAEKIKSLNARYQKVASYLQIPDAANFANTDRLCVLLTRILNVPAVDREVLDCVFNLHGSARLAEGLEAGCAWRAAKDVLANIFSDVAWSSDIAQFRSVIADGRQSFISRLGPKYRQASKHLTGLLKGSLPKTADERLELIDKLIDLQKRRSDLGDEEAFLEDTLGGIWRGERTPFSDLSEAYAWRASLEETGLDFSSAATLELATSPEKIEEIVESLTHRSSSSRQSTEEVLRYLNVENDIALSTKDADQCRFKELVDFLTGIAANTHRYVEWVEFLKLRTQLCAAKLQSLVDHLAAGNITPERAVTEFRYARAEAIWKRALSDTPALKKVKSFDRHNCVQAFQEAERQRFTDTTTLIRARHLAQFPQGASGEMGVIRGEIGKSARHKPIRQLMATAGSAVQRIKPVFLMSPISVAQFLPPGKVEFDLLVIDEASQVRPEDALGSTARAKQVVVVGDQKQLPPSSFFDRLTSNDDEDEDESLQGAARATELESILSLCEARGLAQRMLEWHYRSRDPSLIAVSNAEFYDHNLILPPSPLQNDPSFGLKLTRVDGVYDRGGKRVNRIEAEAVVQRVAEHASAHPDFSLGIVTFSSSQRDMITELLEIERRKNEVLDTFLREDKPEDVLVQNIENVQGDERDVILVSVGYGPEQPKGRLPSMNFGPVNKDGGERRLNVLFTRSRLRCEIFASFDPGDIDLNRTSKTGPRVLKRYLEFAKTGVLDERIATNRDADSPFEEDVADEMRRLGYEVDHQVGSAGFLIDLGVRHPERPGKYILAVECDGATYHSALWARERDRLRQGVLEQLGWRFHRIWSTDWFYRRADEIDQLRIALEQAKSLVNADMGITGANEGTSSDTSTEPQINDGNTIEISASVVREYPPYERYTCQINSALEPHEVPTPRLSELAMKIVNIEGPVHVDEVARRIASCFGKERTGRRITEAAQKALLAAKRSQRFDVSNEGKFWFTSSQCENPPIRNRADESGVLVKAAYLPPMEIKAALAVAVTDNAGGSPEELVRAAASMMGFKRVGPDIHAAFTKHMSVEKNSIFEIQQNSVLDGTTG